MTHELSDYEITVQVRRDRAPGMQWLVDTLSHALEADLGLWESDYGILVKGPPELSIVVRDRR